VANGDAPRDRSSSPSKRASVRQADKQESALVPAADQPSALVAVSEPETGSLEQYEEEAPVDPIAPTSGIEIMYSFEQDGETYFTIHDLRHHKLIHNVTADTDRRLWRSAISHRQTDTLDHESVTWHGDFGLWRSYRPRSGERRYNLLYRGDGELRVFYGVTESGLSDQWRAVL
jgi:hypothetical protein